MNTSDRIIVGYLQLQANSMRENIDVSLQETGIEAVASELHHIDFLLVQVQESLQRCYEIPQRNAALGEVNG